MVISIGDGHRIAALLPELGAMLARPLVTLERVRVCKRDGVKLAEPHEAAETDASGLGVWQKLMVYAGEQSSHRGHQLNGELVRSLRRAGAAGATSLRGIWGYHGDHLPHGDSFWQLRRRVPVLTVIVDTPTASATGSPSSTNSPTRPDWSPARWPPPTAPPGPRSSAAVCGSPIPRRDRVGSLRRSKDPAVWALRPPRVPKSTRKDRNLRRSQHRRSFPRTP
jgi:PII-like signaling protein